MIENQLKTAAPRPYQPMPTRAFAEWGLGQCAYIKPIEVNGERLYGVFAANGEQMGMMRSPAVARAAVIQHGLEPVSTH